MLACSVSLAACWMVVVQWGYCISSSEGGLGGLSSQLLLKGFSVLGGTASVQGGGALTSGVLRAVWLVAFKQGGYSFSSGEDALGSLSSPCSLKGLSRLRSVAQQAFIGGRALAGSVPPRGGWLFQAVVVWLWQRRGRPQRPLLAATLVWEGHSGTLCGDRLRHQPLWLMARSELA